jgi:hypothetical protein
MKAKSDCYEAIEIDGQWFVTNLRNPDGKPYPALDKHDAEINAKFWNILERRAIYGQGM